MLVWLWVACSGGDPAKGDDTDALIETDVAETDGGETDAADTDVDPVETDVVDTDPADTDAVDTDPVDTDPPVDTGPFPFAPDPTCAYLDLDLYVVRCGGVQSFMRRWAPEDGDPTCPPYYTVTGDAWLDPSTALAESSCDDTCVYTAFQAVMLVYCGSRGEYIVWVGGGPGQDPATASCPDLYEVHTIAGDAWVPDFATYEASYPCP
jgi:hypothetical protein